jgi:AAA15 family ATPase/GTPase
MICSFYFQGPKDDNWGFQETAWERINLLVGASGSGKTRFLNTLFNISSTVVKSDTFLAGFWTINIRTDEYEYIWEYKGSAANKLDPQITREVVKRKAMAEKWLRELIGQWIKNGDEENIKRAFLGTPKKGTRSFKKIVQDHQRDIKIAAKIRSLRDKGSSYSASIVEQPTKFEMAMNLKTAKQIGVTIPHRVLARADRVIK